METTTEDRIEAGMPAWPDTLTRVPFEAYQSRAVHDLEQQRIYEGATWNYLCLEAELREPGDYVSTFMGAMPVVVTRDADGELYGFENRCAHRGALIALENAGNAKGFSCVYHAWAYDLQGNVKGVAFQHGVNGKGGMPAGFDAGRHAPRKLRIAATCGLVFGSLSDDVDPIEEYIGEDVLARIRRLLGDRPLEVIGRYTQILPNNWKLYFENVKDSYHASLLHLFLTTFEINRLTQRGGLIVSPDGGSHVSYSIIDKSLEAGSEYKDQELRVDNEHYRLQDPSFLDYVDEVGDGITLQILSVFPGFVLGQVNNSMVVRQVLPKDIDATELNWTYLGYADDTPELRRMRHRQLNLVGPAGLVSMEDGAVGGFVQRGVGTAREYSAVLEMGGEDTASSDTRATEASVRGFWKAYRRHMGV
ncbi:aromatic ring-hydroxylating dioxygenase subunit alpha [Pigmentiphaga sp.]|uniref:aromatic ring-hydroxylating dioxygenase subunit alpha n=1 Tax=Pigmentiphaga sp. TaxID=1977564 RepID=UPI00128E188B|nr:aromatic ring-hydroxylating dioxygenase subunit alpha [Pigmentiphaga sp.]MPS28223.1 Rieske (2Fe-2S) protein [Alcaligenaceae bacterium SAGV5]MPS28372.1 Rieske (2Fe-2S) protein [Alcaligenaceae bacterium SAGV5]MPS51421.1 Rieske (2Fe-2S) protein [Alcaligenaceae bacterium SAGV3]MPT55989.1 Rieske (2Fe-2S) protein [Alcaligenaceae bacterium]